MFQPAMRAARRTLRAGFTLIEILVVIAIIGVLATFLLVRIPEAMDAADVTACKANMSEIYKGFILYKTTFSKAPSKSGVRFFTELVSTDTLENSRSVAKKMTCPGVETNSLSGIANRPETDWYADLEAVDGSYSAYAGRNCAEFPLRKFPGSGKEPLVADDNDPEMNHRHTTVVLYADGSVQTYEIATLKEQGVLGPDETVLVVGPESPVEDLRKLSLD